MDLRDTGCSPNNSAGYVFLVMFVTSVPVDRHSFHLYIGKFRSQRYQYLFMKNKRMDIFYNQNVICNRLITEKNKCMWKLSVCRIHNHCPFQNVYFLVVVCDTFSESLVFTTTLLPDRMPFLFKEHSSFMNISLLERSSSTVFKQHNPFQFCGLWSILIKTSIMCFSIQTKHDVVWTNVGVKEK